MFVVSFGCSYTSPSLEFQRAAMESERDNLKQLTSSGYFAWAAYEY